MCVLGLNPPPLLEMAATAVVVALVVGGVFAWFFRRWAGRHRAELEARQRELEEESARRRLLESERTRLLSEHQELLARWRLQLDRLPIGCIISDASTRFTYWNPAAERIFGHTQEEVVGRGPESVAFTHGEKSGVAGTFRRAAGGDESAGGLEENLTKDGREIVCEWHHTPLRRSDGSLMGLMSIVQDVTDRAQWERQLERSELRLRQVFEGVVDPVWDWDIKADRTSFSPGWATMLGYSPGEAEPAPDSWERAVHPDDLPAAKARLSECLEGRIAAYEAEYRLRTRVGAWKWVVSRGRVVERDGQGQPVRMIGSISDITELKRVQQAEHESRITHEALVEAIPDLVFRMRRDGTYLDYSGPDGAKLLVPPHEFLGRRAEEVLSPEMSRQAMAALEATLRTGEIQTYEYKVPGSDGTKYCEVRMVRSAEDEVLAIVRNISERKRAEAALRRTEQKLALHVQQTAVGVIEWTLDFKVADWNAGAERIFGYTREQAMGRDAVELLVPEGAREHVRRMWGVLLTRRGGNRSTNENCTADGRTIVCVWYNTPLVDEAGEVLGAASMVADVTERVRAEEEVRRSRENYEALVNTIDGIVWEADPSSFRFLLVSKQAERILGYPVEAWTNNPNFWVEHVHAADREWAVPFCLKAVSEGVDHQFEYRMVKADGSTVWLRDHVTVVTEQGRVTKLRGVMVDITERRRAEEALRESESRFRRVVDSNMIGVYFWEVSGAITEANDVFLKMVGYTRQELAAGRMSWRNMTPREIRGISERALEQMQDKGITTAYTKEFVRKDGSRVPVLMGAAFLEGSRSKGVSFVLDITERKRAEERQAFMMAELDHRVKNNMAAVVSLAEQTLKGSANTAEASETLLGRLRALARTHNALAQTHWDGARLTSLVRQTLDAFRLGATSAVLVEGEEVILPARTAAVLAMALHELATNALKHGSLSTTAGRVGVRWNTEAGGCGLMLRLVWQESGGPPVSPPTRRGFGRELIEGGVAYEASGSVRLEFPPEGVRCEMALSLEAEAVRGPGMDDQGPQGGAKLAADAGEAVGQTR